jgi:hypothetical protein
MLRAIPDHEYLHLPESVRISISGSEGAGEDSLAISALTQKFPLLSFSFLSLPAALPSFSFSYAMFLFSPGRSVVSLRLIDSSWYGALIFRRHLVGIANGVLSFSQ